MQILDTMTTTVRNYGGETVGTVVHAFERAGLGKAPFRFDGFEVRTFQACHGAPVQPGTCCDFCFTGISNVFWIKSADGKRFKVGCDCVEKTGDRGLRKVIDAKVAEHRRALSHKRDDAKIAAALEILPFVSVTLALRPHPNAWRNGETMLDHVEWMLANAGRAGRVKVAKVILDAAKSAA